MIPNTETRIAVNYDTKGQPMKQEVKLSAEDFATLAICAIRYCHGRQTYMPSTVQGIVKAHLAEITDLDLHVLIDDCNMQEELSLYGDETINKPRWLEYRKALLDEADRRNLK